MLVCTRHIHYMLKCVVHFHHWPFHFIPSYTLSIVYHCEHRILRCYSDFTKSKTNRMHIEIVISAIGHDWMRFLVRGYNASKLISFHCASGYCQYCTIPNHHWPSEILFEIANCAVRFYWTGRWTRNWPSFYWIQIENNSQPIEYIWSNSGAMNSIIISLFDRHRITFFLPERPFIMIIIIFIAIRLLSSKSQQYKFSSVAGCDARNYIEWKTK